MIALGVSLASVPIWANGVSFSPLSLFSASESGAWLDPSDLSAMFQDAAGTTPVTAPGQSVGRVLDKSGRGNHATQATAAARPTYQVDSNDRGYLSFDGVDDFLVTPTITPNIDKVQVFAGVRKLSDAVTAIIAETSSNANNNNGSFFISGPIVSATPNYGVTSRGTTLQSISKTGFPAPNTSIFTLLSDISAPSVSFNLNGSQAAQSTASQGTGNFLAYPLYIGRRAGTSLPFNGRIYGLIVRFGANLTADQITQTETWMNSKTGAF